MLYVEELKIIEAALNKDDPDYETILSCFESLKQEVLLRGTTNIEFDLSTYNSMACSAILEHKSVGNYLSTLHAKNLRENHYEQYSEELLAKIGAGVKSGYSEPSAE